MLFDFDSIRRTRQNRHKQIRKARQFKARRAFGREFARTLQMEQLEDRRVLATLTWIGDVDANWNTDNGGDTNWSGDALPTDEDTLIFDGNAPGILNNDTTAGNSYILNFTAGGYTIDGNAITLDEPGTDISDSAGNNITVNLTLAADTEINVSSPAFPLLLGGVLSGDSLTKTGDGDLALNGVPNTYTGATNVDAGTLAVVNGGSVNSTNPVTIAAGASIAGLTGGGAFNAPIDGAAGSTVFVTGGVSLTAGTGTASGFSTLGTVDIRDGGTLTLVDSNVATLGPSTQLAPFGGTATLNAANGISLSAGDELVGNGTITGDISVNSGTIAPGLSAGDINVTGDVTFGSSGTYEAEIDGAASGQFDTLDITGSGDLGGANLDLSGSSHTPLSGESYTILTYNPLLTGNFTDTDGNLLNEGDTVFVNGQPLAISYTGGAVTLGFDDEPVFNAGPGDNDITVRHDGGDNIQVVIDGTTVMNAPASSITSITVNGEGGDDTLTVDFAAGDPVPANGISFNGGSQTVSDSLIVTGGSFTTIESSYDNPNDGDVDLDGNVITYTGLEPVLINVGTVQDVVFNLPAGPNTDVLLGDDGPGNFGATDPVNDPNTSAINASTFEFTQFTNPTNSLTVNLGDNGDTMDVVTFDPLYAASLIINGGAANSDNVQMTNVDLIDTPGRGLEVTEVETLDITGGEISGNSVTGDGGGVLIKDSTSGSTTATMSGVTVSSNTASQDGGGIFNDGATLDISNNSTISGNVASGRGGGIFNETDGNLTLDGISITGNQSDSNGGGIANNSFPGLGLTLTNVTLNNNDAAVSGGGLHVQNPGDVNITGGTVNGNTALQGGGLSNGSSGTMTISGTTIDGNTATGNFRGGGGIFNSAPGSSRGTVLLLNASSVTNNVANGTLAVGGGVQNKGELTIEDSSVTGNSATLGGGGIENSVSGPGSILNIDNSTISSNSAIIRGGGIDNAGRLTIENGSLISGNSADIGGGISQTAASSGGGISVTIDGSTVSGNSADSEGGGIWNFGDLTLRNNTDVSGNTAGDDGGGLFLREPGSVAITVSITDTTIDGNTASGNAPTNGGGGIFNFGTTLTLGNTVSITNNVADGTAGSGGGIFNDTDGDLTLNGTTITGNRANRAGGGIEDNSGSGLGLTLTNVSLNNNNAGVSPAVGSPGNGGGLHVSSGGDVDITGGTVNGNTAAAEGGGLWNSTGTMTISGTTINGNTASGNGATQGGGGIFNAGGTVIADAGTTITNNDADGASGSGGGVFNDGGTIDLTGTLIQSNTANRAGGGIETIAGNVNLTNVTLDGNQADGGGNGPGNGGGLHITGAGDVDINGGTIINNSAAAEGGGLWNSSTGSIFLNDAAGDVLVDNNVAAGDAAPGVGGVNVQGGGGIFNDGGSVTFSNSSVTNTHTISNNQATGTTNGSGGGILSIDGIVVGVGISILDNSAVRAGGGVEVVNSTSIGDRLELRDSTIDGNTVGSSPGNGGGFHITGTGRVVLDGSTVSNNTANEGGGLWNSSAGTFVLTNSTISSNTATTSDGGGIFNTSGGTVDLHSVTITLNDAGTGVGSGIAGGSSGVSIQNTIVAQNPGPVGNEENLAGTIDSDDHNLIGDPDDGTLVGDTDQTIFGADALLGPLQDNGGPTFTHLPSAGSPAIGNGDALDVDNLSELTVDQRDVSRPQGGQDDIGAVEVELQGFVVSADDLSAGQAGDGNPDEFLITMDDQGTPDTSDDEVVVFVNSVEVFRESAVTTGLIVIRGSADDDTLTMDNSDGLIRANIIFDADGVGTPSGVINPGGFDQLILRGDTPTTTTYNPGDTSDAGGVFQENNQVLQRVEFFGLEPVQVVGTGPGDTLIVGGQPLGVGFPQALQDDNTINYTEGPNSNQPFDPTFAGDTTGFVTVDGFESLEFSRFGTLQIDAGAGSDQVHLNHPSNPTDLAAIDVDGGDPTASDDVIVNNTDVGTAITVDSLTTDGGVVTGAQFVPVTVTTTEHLILHGQGAEDDLLVETPAGRQRIVYTPGVNATEASIDIREFSGTSLLSIDYVGFDVNAFLTFGDAGDVRDDQLDFFATAADDEFTVSAAGEITLDERAPGSAAQTLDVVADGVRELNLFGLDGDDVFNIPGDHPFTLGVTVQGGDPSASDVLNFNAEVGGGLATLDYDGNFVRQSATSFVFFTGIELVNLDANDNAVDIDGTLDDDFFTVRPNDAEGALVELAGHNTKVQVDNTTDLEIDGDNGIGLENTVNVVGTAGNDTITVDEDAGQTRITIAGRLPIRLSDVQEAMVSGVGGDDDLTVDVDGTGLLVQPLIFHGGQGADSLTVTGTPSVTVDTTTYTPGPTNDAGRLEYDTDDADTDPNMIIEFTGLEPVVDLLPSANLVVNGTNGENAINYTQSDINPAWGKVSVDAFEPIHFANKTTLTINGLAGSDAIHLNNGTTPTGLTGIEIDGGDPTDSDTLTVNGLSGATVTVDLAGAPLPLITGAEPVDVEYSTISDLTVVAGPGSTELAVDGSTSYGVSFDAAADEGTVQTDDIAIAFQGYGAGSTLDLTTSGAPNSVTVDGTAADDLFTVAANGDITLNGRATVETTSVTDVTLQGFDGDDTFVVASGHGYTNLTLSGGGPGASDRAELTGDGTTIDVELGTPVAQVTGGGLDTVNLAGVEVLDLDAATADVNVLGSDGDDRFEVTPTGLNSANIALIGQNTVVEASAIGDLTIDGDDANTTISNTVVVRANDTENTIGIDSNSVDITGRQSVGLNDIQAVEVFGGAGSDTFNVDFTTPILHAVFIDGGDPIGITPPLPPGEGDTIVPVTAGSPAIISQGPEPDEGGILVAGSEIVSFDHIEKIGPVGPGPGPGPVPVVPAIILGTNGDDDITIIARDSSTHPLTDGVQDFTVSVNGGPEILFINQPELVVDSLSGDDDIVLRTPAPNNAAWDVDVTIVGGPPSAATGDQGDVFELETPGSDAEVVQYTATGSDTGFIDVTTIGGGDIADITLANSFTLPDPLGGPIPFFVSSPGGVEQFVYDGEGDDDQLTILGDGLGADTDDTIVHQVGTAPDEGSFRVNNLLAVSYQNVGLGATLAVDGGSTVADDEFVYVGTPIVDNFTVGAGVLSGNVVGLNDFLDVVSEQISELTLLGLDGDDHFTIDMSMRFDQVNIEGGNPSASDVVEVVGDIGVDEEFTVSHDDTLGSGSVLEAGGATIDYVGVERVDVVGNAADADTLTVEGTLADDALQLVPGTRGDRVQGNFQIPVEAVGSFDELTVDISQFGNDSLTVDMTLLVAADMYAVEADADDVEQLVVRGTAAADVVTTTATSITVAEGANTNTLNFTPAQLNLLTVQTLGGDDDVTIDAWGVLSRIETGDGDDQVALNALTANATVFGGAGDDTIDGSGVADDSVRLTLHGEAGNDNLIGGDSPTGAAPGDFLFGGPGNDRLEGGRGQDEMFGGDGSDLFVWNPGDGSDLIEGGDGASDELQFIANAGDNRLEVFGGGRFGATGNPAPAIFGPGTLEDASRVIFALNSAAQDDAAVFLNLADVENIDIDADAGADQIVVNNQVDPTTSAGDPQQLGTDLAHTSLRSVDIDLGVADASEDNVEVHGRLIEDNIDATVQAGVVDIAGFDYNIGISSSEAADDRLHLHGQDGDDNIKAADGVEATIALTLNGGPGDDFLSADAVINGGPGDDFLQGGSGDDTLNGGPGEDTMVGGGGDDTFDGGDDFDTILIEGTTGDDVIDVNQVSAVLLTHTVNGTLENDTLVSGTVEEARVEAGDGADTIRITVDDSLFDDPGLSLRMTVHGGADSSFDRLGIVDDGTDDLTIYRKSQDDSAGSAVVGPGNDEPFVHIFDGIERVQFVDEAGVALNQGTEADARLVVFKHDPFEFNDDRFEPTHLGVNQTVNVDPTIDPGPDPNFGFPSDQDWYRVQAEVTGTLDFQVFFEEIGTLNSGRPGLPDDGNLDIEVYDIDGTLIAGGGPLFGGNDGTGVNPELNVDGEPFEENERIRIPSVQGQVYFLRVFGVGDAVNAYDISVVNVAAPVPYDIELDDLPADPDFDCTDDPPSALNSDTGRSHLDDVTCDNSPGIVIRLDDDLLLKDLPGNPDPDSPFDEVIPIPFNPSDDPDDTTAGYRVAIFIEGDPQQPGQDPQVLVGFADKSPAVDGVYTFDFDDAFEGAGLDLTDGSHFINAKVQIIDPADPAQSGFGARSQSLEIVVDTVPPPVSFGQPGVVGDGVISDSDTGVSPPNPDTIIDLVTFDTTPRFWGRAEANAIVRVFADVNGNDMLDAGDLFLGQDTAIPIDGTNQEPDGFWEIQSVKSLNDPDFFPLDGPRTLFVTAEDLAGNENAPGDTVGADADEILDLFVDTQGPRVDEVFITSDPDFDLFDPKPSEDGPTPLVNSLTIKITDPPERVAPFLHPALKADVAENPGHYLLVGDANGVIPIDSVIVTNLPVVSGAEAMATIELVFVEPLPDDRFTLTISDSISDPVGNALDGETNTIEPLETPLFPSGDGVPGGDFVARFTIDTRPELGTWAGGSIYVDTNGNFRFDPTNVDFVNRDITYAMGFTSDDVFAGNFAGPGPDGIFGTPDDTTAAAGDGVADGFDKLAVYGQVGGTFRFLIDIDNDGVPDLDVSQTIEANGVPVAGNFDGNAANGDEVGVFTGREWIIDTDHDYVLDTTISSDMRGYPIVGDFDGDGTDDFATWADDRFQIDTSGDARFDLEFRFGFIGTRERPVAADFNADGFDDLGLWVPDREGQPVREAAEWYLLLSENGSSVLDRVRTDVRLGLDVIDFTPIPFGPDIYAQYGDEFALPVVGNFDPPVTRTVTPQGNRHFNLRDLEDVNDDGHVTAHDLVLIVAFMNEYGSRQLFGEADSAPYLDSNMDGFATALDAARVVNRILRDSRDPVAEGESPSEIDAGKWSTPVSRLSLPPFETGGEAGGNAVIEDDSHDNGENEVVRADWQLEDGDSFSEIGVFRDLFANKVDDEVDLSLDEILSEFDESERQSALDKIFGQL